MRELLIGAGNARRKKLFRDGDPEWHDLVTLDIDPDCGADVLWDLNERPLPFVDGEFDEIHAYEVLEHVGRQGDWREFFAEFSEYHRILKLGGLLIASVPRWDSPWAWGDPGHTRVISTHTLSFLDQEHIAREVGVTAMTDYRAIWTGDFRLVHESYPSEHTLLFALMRAGE